MCGTARLDSLQFTMQLWLLLCRAAQMGSVWFGHVDWCQRWFCAVNGEQKERKSLFLLWSNYRPAVAHTNMHKQIQTCNRLMGLCGDQTVWSKSSLNITMCASNETPLKRTF